MSQPVIEIKNLKKSFPPSFNLEVERLDLCEGMLYCLRGINGSGKTTLINILLDLTLADSGKISVFGEDHKSDKAKKHISSFLDKDRILDFLTVKEYFYLVGSSYNKTKNEVNEQFEWLDSYFGRNYFSEKKLIKDYSGGNRQLIALMGALIVNSPVVVLDEPLNFLDTETAAKFCDLLNDYIERTKAAVIFTSNSEQFHGLKDIHFIEIKDGRID